MGHTPGQWEFIRRSDTSANIEVSDGDLRSVLAEIREGSLCDEHGGHYLDNARLMFAAPDLLAALEAYVDQTTKFINDYTKEMPDATSARAAIAKAKGKE